MSILIFASTLLGSIISVLSLLSQLALWQQKEYRWDRLWSHLKSPQGSLLNYPIVLLAIVNILLGWLMYLNRIPLTGGNMGGWIKGVGLAALILFFLHHALRIRKRGLIRPDFTIRALLTLLAATIFSLYIPFLAMQHPEISGLLWATTLLCIPISVGIAVSLAGIPFMWQKKKIIARATRLRTARTNLKVVGITGSYGKTSTKHFLEQILEKTDKKFAATKAHHNTPIGIAQDVLSQLKPELEIYVAELGAYRLGEIKELADIVQPQIGVLTAIGNQHADLFGSPENIRKAKWELIKSLPSFGVAVLNADNTAIKDSAKNEKRSIVWYSLKHKTDVWVEHVSIASAKVTFTLHLREFSQGISLPLASEALLGSAIAAAAAALAVEVPAQTIADALQSLAPFARTMEIKEGKNSAAIIDDSYSANEHGTLIAIRHLARFSQPDKRVVFLPFLELGKENKMAQQRVEVAAHEVGAKLYIYEKDPKTFAAKVSEGLSEKSVVLLEGRLPDVVRQAVLK